MNLVRGVADLLRKSPQPPGPPAPPSPSVRGGSFPGADIDDAPAPRVVFRYITSRIGTCDLFVRRDGSVRAGIPS